MRSITLEHVTRAEDDDLLTTGAAAKLLGTSRQHVVNLCNAGNLAFTTTGHHRRVRRRDVEAASQRTHRMTREQRRSAWINLAVAGRLVAAPDAVLNLARKNLATLQQSHQRGQGAHWLQQWQELLDGPLDRVLETLTSSTPWAREMRQNSPFAGVLAEEERAQILLAFKAYAGTPR